jgi:Holliday junction resolvase RusA-like endonuclease
MIRFFVGGLPKSMKVAGIARFQRAGKVHMVPKRSNSEWATLVGQIGREYAPKTPLGGGLSFIAVFWMPKPATLKKTMVLPLKRPDLDNLMHKLTDQFNGVFWVDDSQIVDLHVYKRFTIDGRTGVEIRIEAPILAELATPMSSGGA